MAAGPRRSGEAAGEVSGHDRGGKVVSGDRESRACGGASAIV
jgi:hypothetical protein